MNDILKQRLVGALVLIALGVVFWPVIFVQSERPALDRSSQLPPMPGLEKTVIETPQPLPDIDPVAAVEEIALHDAPPQARDSDAGNESSPEPRPTLDENGIPVAWVLQVASVSKREKAEALREELIGQGYKAYTRIVRHDNEVLHRVYVGPVFERQKLQQAKQDVDGRLKVNAIIARYVP